MLSTTLRPASIFPIAREHISSETRVPLVTLGVSLVCAAFMFLPDLVPTFEFDRAAIASGQLWRILTGHLTHWNFDHYIWDGIVLLVLGVLCERSDRNTYVACLLGSAVLISLSMWCCMPEIATYRGLSGLDSALFALLAGNLLVENWSERQWHWVVGLLGALLGFGMKVGYEVATARTLFVDSVAADFIPVALAHAVGACIGLLLVFRPKRLDALIFWRRSEITRR